MPVKIGDHIELPELSSVPGTPASGRVVLYAKTDGKLYYKDDTGTEREVLGVQGAAGSDGAAGSNGTNASGQSTVLLGTDRTVKSTTRIHQTAIDDGVSANTSIAVPAVPTTSGEHHLAANVIVKFSGTGTATVKFRLGGTGVIDSESESRRIHAHIQTGLRRTP